jgi:glycosyltransferase 2 family protein
VNQPSASPDEAQSEQHDQPVPQSLLRRIVSCLKWPAAVSLITWLGYQNREQFERLLSGEQEIHWEFLAAAFALCMSSIVLTFFRWYLLVVALDFPFQFRDALRLGFLGCLFNYVAPGAVGGDAIKAVVLANEQTSRRAVAVATILLDRILGLLALLMVGAGAALVVPTDIEHRAKIVAVLWGGASAGLVGLMIMLSPAARSRPVLALTKLPKVGGIFADLLDAVTLYQSRRGVVILAVLISVVAHFGVISSFYLCALAVAAQQIVPDYATHLFLIPLAEIIGVITPVPAGLGALEGAVQESYRLAGATPEIGFLAAGAYRATSLVIAIAGAGFYVLQKKRIAALLASDPDRLGNDASADETSDHDDPATTA